MSTLLITVILLLVFGGGLGLRAPPQIAAARAPIEGALEGSGPFRAPIR